MIREDREILRAWASGFGIDLSFPQISLLDIYLDELLAWNKRMNLTGLFSRQRIIRELLLDSIIPVAFLPAEGQLLDVGSGAGFPGIPLKIFKPGLEVHLLEANAKKVSFLKQAIRLTKLSGIHVIRTRIEELADVSPRQGYPLITARALAKLPQTLAWCAPHLIPKGLIVTFQGAQIQQTLKESNEVLQKQQLSLHTSVPYTLPDKASPRHLLIFRKDL